MRTRSTIRLALNTAKMRRETIDGRKYLIAPTTLIVSGVLSGSKGSLLYPEAELSRDPSAWDNIPLTAGHPALNGKAVSARSPAIIERFGLGRVYNVTYDTDRKRLRGEAWIDEEKARQLRPDILAKVQNGTRLEISTGLFTDNTPAKGTYNGKSYTFIARDYRPDHLAVLDTKGACSVEDGCGLNVNQQTGEMTEILDKLPKGFIRNMKPGDRWKRVAVGTELKYKVTRAQRTENVNPEGCNQYKDCAGGGGGTSGGLNRSSALKVLGKANSPGQSYIDHALRQTKDAGMQSGKRGAGNHQAAAKAHRESEDYHKSKSLTAIADAHRAMAEWHEGRATTNQAQASFDDLRKALRRELTTRFGQVEIVDVFPKSVVYSRLSYGPQDTDTVARLYEVGYSADKRGKVTLDDSGAKEVQRVTTYETVSNVSQLVETINANPQGCNQYGCKGSGGRSVDQDVEGVRGMDLLPHGTEAQQNEVEAAGSVKRWLAMGTNRVKNAVRQAQFPSKETYQRAAEAHDNLARQYATAAKGLSKSSRLAKDYGMKMRELEKSASNYRLAIKQGYASNEATNQDGRRVGPSVFNQEEEPDMAHEPLTNEEKEQLIEALVTNDNGFEEDDREWLGEQDDDRLRSLAETAAEVKVLNQQVAELGGEVATLNKKGTKNAKGAKNKGMPPWLKKKIDDKDEEETDGEEEDMEENCKGKKPTKNAKVEESDDEETDNEDEDCECEDNEMTDNRSWRDLMDPAEREVMEEGLAFRQAKRGQLVKTITANKRNRFTKEYLEGLTTNALEAMAELAADTKRQAAPAYAGMGAPTVRMTANSEPVMEEPLGVPEPDYVAFAASR